MLIPVIKFEIHNFAEQIFGEYMVSDTLENQEMIFSHRYTRNITFDRVFSFQFEKEMAIPAEMISMDTWVRMWEKYPLTMLSEMNELQVQEHTIAA